MRKQTVMVVCLVLMLNSQGFSIKINGEALAEDLIADNRVAAYGRQVDNILELDQDQQFAKKPSYAER